jgi:NADP-dependent 3-hydroxy acid dehydrogenase YdfG
VLFIVIDVSDLEQMKEAISKSECRFGEINGVIHTAGLVVCISQKKERYTDDNHQLGCLAGRGKGHVAARHHS